MLLATFKISKDRDENGHEIEPCCEFEGGTVWCVISNLLPQYCDSSCSHPKPFAFTIEPRTEDVRLLIERMEEELETVNHRSDGDDP